MAPRCQVQYKNISGKVVKQANHLLKECSRYVKTGDVCAQKILPWLQQKRSALSQEIILGFSPMVTHKFIVKDVISWGKRQGVILERFLTNYFLFRWGHQNERDKALAFFRGACWSHCIVINAKTSNIKESQSRGYRWGIYILKSLFWKKTCSQSVKLPSLPKSILKTALIVIFSYRCTWGKSEPGCKLLMQKFSARVAPVQLARASTQQQDRDHHRWAKWDFVGGTFSVSCWLALVLVFFFAFLVRPIEPNQHLSNLCHVLNFTGLKVSFFMALICKASHGETLSNSGFPRQRLLWSWSWRWSRSWKPAGCLPKFLDLIQWNFLYLGRTRGALLPP